MIGNLYTTITTITITIVVAATTIITMMIENIAMIVVGIIRCNCDGGTANDYHNRYEEN